MARPDNLWSMGDIARYLGVDPSTASNYRKRFADDFPKAQVVEGSSRSYFKRDDVVAWIGRHSQLGPASAPRPTDGRIVFEAADLLRGYINSDDVADAVGTVLVALEYKKRRGGRAEVTSIPEARESILSTSGLVGGDRTGQFLVHRVPDEVLLKTYGVLGGVRDRSAAYDEVLFGALRGSIAQFRTSSKFAAFLSALVPGPSRSVFDPAAGVGELLRVVANDHGAAEGRGMDIHEKAVEAANRRFYLAGVDLRVELGDSFRAGADLFSSAAADFRADLVVADAPFGLSAFRMPAEARWVFGTPGASSTDLAWIDLAVQHLTSEGRAIVVTRDSMLFQNDSATDGIRRELVRTGALEAVVSLPSGAREGTTVRTAVWIVRRPDRARRREAVLLVNAPNEVSEALLLTGATVTTVRSWLADENTPLDATLAAAVPAIDLLAPGATLVPNRWTETPVDAASPSEWADRITNVYRSTVGAVRTMPALPSAHFEPDDRTYPRVRVGDLLSISAKRIRGRYIERTAADEAPGLRMLNVVSARAGGSAADEDIEWVADSPANRAQEVLPGDIVVYPDGDRVSAVVWREPGWVLGRFMQVVRLVDETWNREYVAASLASSANQRFLVEGTARTHFHLEEFELVARPLADQERLAFIASSLAHLETELKQTQSRAREAHRLLLDAFSAGVVDVRLISKTDRTKESRGDADAL